MPDPRKQAVESGYDRLAHRYLEWAQTIADDPRHRMLSEFVHRLREGARILDLGCGAGVPSTRELALRFRVVGVDISPAQVELARQNVPEAEFLRADFAELTMADASMDGVVSLYAMIHVPREEHPRLFARIFGWLVPGGLFLASLGARDSPDWTGEWLGDEMFFSGHDADENRRLLRDAGFTLLIDELAVTHEPDGDVAFLWVLAQKPPAAATSR